VEQQFVQPTAIVPIEMEQQKDMEIASRFGGRVQAMGQREILVGGQAMAMGQREVVVGGQAMAMGTRSVVGATYGTTTGVTYGSTFDALDRNHDGVITRAEFAAAMR